jgi:hypothetical protein
MDWRERRGEGGGNSLIGTLEEVVWFGGIYTPVTIIGSTDMGSVLPRVQEN